MRKSTSSLKENIKHKYSKYLKLYRESKESFEKELLELLQDLAIDMEIYWDWTDIRYDTIMTKKKWDEFSKHPKRLRYRSEAFKSFNTLEKKFNFVVELLKDTYPYYKSLGESKFRDSLKNNIAALLDCSLEGKHTLEKIRFADTYVGRSEEDRDDGIIDPTLVSTSSLDYAIREHAYFSDKDYKKLKDRIYSVCEGRSDLLFEYVTTCDVPNGFKEDLRKIGQILRRDNTLSFYEMRLGWKIWKIVREIGMDVDAFLDLIDFPNYITVEKKLLSFQNNKEFIEEVLNHMKDDLPESYKKYKKEGYVFLHELFGEEARRKEYPKKLRSMEDIEKMIKSSKEEIYSYFPLAKKTSPRSMLINPTHPASLTRAFQSNTRNSRKESINVTVMTPRTDHKDRYLSTLAHEVTHGLHRLVDEMGEESGVLEKGSSKRIPSSVSEEFSQLVGDHFQSDKDLPYTKKFKGKIFSNFISAYSQRHQVPYSLVQLGIRRKFDEWWNDGFRDELTPEMIWELKYEFDKKVKEWMETGIKIVRDGGVNSFNLFDPSNLDDGLTYMKRYVVEDTSLQEGNESNEKGMTMKEAFEKRFGKEWVEDKDARTILLWILLESGRNHKTEGYYKFILEKEVSDCFKELKLIGIQKKDI